MAGVALRSLFLEASWNYRGQQNLGLAAAIDPALKSIHTDAEALKAARLRSLSFFNTNPLAGGLAIGVAIRLEQDVAEGRLSPAERDRMLMSLSSGALAPLGDNLFWFSWLPFCSLVGVWAVLSLESWWAPLLLPFLFCLLALPARVYGLRLGYRHGNAVTDLLLGINVAQIARNIKRTVAVIVGASTVIVLYSKTGLRDFSAFNVWLSVFTAAAFVCFFKFVLAGSGIVRYWYPLILLALGLVIGIAAN
jgi:PTS system mannose-specific IID component